MQKKRKLFNYLMTGALSFGIIGGVGVSPSFAATSTGTATQVKDDVYPKFDEATKQKIKVIHEQVKAGTLTKEAAQKQLDALGVKLPMKEDRGFHGALAKLDAQTQQKVKDIFKQVKAGTLTKEAAQKQLDALGVKLPMKEDRGFHGALAKLDAQTQQKVKDIFKQVKAGTLTKEAAQKQLDALGVKLPMREDKGPHGALAKLDAQTQQKVKDIFKQVKAGTLTKEAAKNN